MDLVKTRAIWFGAALVPYAVASLAPDPKPTFSGTVLPIFKAHCFSCHAGPNAAAGLDLTSSSGLKKGGGSGQAFVAGKPENSLLLDRILGKGGMPRMPMGFAPLSSADVEKIRSWIAAGATFEEAKPTVHWAYVAPVRRKAPVVRNAAWVKNPIDAFVLARLELEKLSPAKRASREILVRRVYLDLIGIPPTPKETDAFLLDRSPNAYEKLVDRLLSNPHFGERLARPWLDLARYADSDGYEKDLNRTAWLYRDWVIDAFNSNKPYDQFTIEQLAGDLMPNSSLSQKVATGFNRNTMFNQEGGVDQEEAYFNVILDRVGTTSTVFLGSTIQCARCHDHKYDPFSQKDFYELYAYFGNGVVLPRGPKEVGEEKWFEPEIKVPSKQQSRALTQFESELATAKKQLAEKTAGLTSEFEAWQATARSEIWKNSKPNVTVSSGEKAAIEPDGAISLFTKTPQLSYTVELKLQPGRWTGFRIQTIPDPRLSNGGAGNADGGNFVLSRVAATMKNENVAIRGSAADFSQEGFSAMATLDKEINTGWAVYPLPGKQHEIAFAFAKPIELSTPQSLVLTLECNSSRWPQHTLAKFRVEASQVENPDQYVLTEESRTLLLKSELTPADKTKLRKQFELVSPTLIPFRAKVDQLQQSKAKLEGEIPTALVLQDKPVQGPLFAEVHGRGEFLNRGEKVKAATPAVFGAIDSKLPSNRLGLARWIASKSNPLTARVEVNRLWEMVFGRGLVETSEDFGTQGAKPSHPELLDWLAVEFMESGWNIKHMLKLMVCSNAYQQDSAATKSLLDRDPQNILLARGSRMRMEAEMIRDSILSAGGLLSGKIGGPSVYPSQPDGVWNTPYSGERWMTSGGEDKYRRGIYTFTKRTSPYPSFLAFDATSREACTVRRVRTNTPLQALAMMNDEVVQEAAKALSVRVAKECPGSENKKLAYAFRVCTGRTPNPKELTVLAKLLSKMRSKYRALPTESKKLGGAESAAWTMVASVILNLDETITKE